MNHFAYAINNPVVFTDPSGACVEPVSFVLCVTVAGTIVGTTTGVACNVFVVQEKGGIENLPDLLKLDYYCDVDWKLAFFSGGLGGLIGAITAATSGHGAEVLYDIASQEALAQEYEFSGRAELVRRAEEQGLSIREFLDGWDPDVKQFRPEELERARMIEELQGVRLIRKRPGDPGSYDWVGSDGEFYDTLGIPEAGSGRPIDEQAQQFINALEDHLDTKSGPNGEPALLPVSLKETDPRAADLIRRHIETLPEHQRRRIIPLDY
jgi:hypothetical protein